MCLVMGDNPVYKGTIRLYRKQHTHTPNPCPNLYATFWFYRDCSLETGGYNNFNFKNYLIASEKSVFWFSSTLCSSMAPTLKGFHKLIIKSQEH